MVGYLWYVMSDGTCPYGPGCYAKKAERYVWVHTARARVFPRGEASVLGALVEKDTYREHL